MPRRFCKCIYACQNPYTMRRGPCIECQKEHAAAMEDAGYMHELWIRHKAVDKAQATDDEWGQWFYESMHESGRSKPFMEDLPQKFETI